MALMPAVLLICTVLLGSGDNSGSSRQLHPDDDLREQRRSRYLPLFPDIYAREDWVAVLADPQPTKGDFIFCRSSDPRTEEFLEKLRSDAEEQGLDEGTKQQIEADIAYFHTYPLCEPSPSESVATQNAPAPPDDGHGNSVRDAAPPGKDGGNTYRAPASQGKGPDDRRRFSMNPGDYVHGGHGGPRRLFTQEQWAAAEKAFADYVAEGVDLVSTWMSRTATDLSQRQQRLWEGIEQLRADGGAGATAKKAGTWMQQKMQQLPTANLLSRWRTEGAYEGDGTEPTKTALIEEIKCSIVQRWDALVRNIDRGGDEEGGGKKWNVEGVSSLLNNWSRRLRAMGGGEVSVWPRRGVSFQFSPVVARVSTRSSPRLLCLFILRLG